MPFPFLFVRFAGEKRMRLMFTTLDERGRVAVSDDFVRLMIPRARA